MKAMQVVESGGGLTLIAADVRKPKPGNGEVLVEVHAAGVTTTELTWYPTTNQKSGEARVQAIPGHEFSGVVAELGEGVSDFTVGQEVYGFNDWFEDGATAEFCVTVPASIAAKPKSLTHVEAASVPIGALTAWQGFFEQAKLKAGRSSAGAWWRRRGGDFRGADCEAAWGACDCDGVGKDSLAREGAGGG